jgi:integrase-like protein
MSEKPISPLRQHMLEDMSLRGFTPDTQGDYIRAVKKLAAFLGRSPDTATAEDLRAFRLHLTATGVQPPTINATVTVLRFFFKVTLDRPETTLTSRFRLRAAQAAARALARGGATPAGGGPRCQAQGGAQRCLRGRPAGHGGCRAEGLRD